MLFHQWFLSVEELCQKSFLRHQGFDSLPIDRERPVRTDSVDFHVRKIAFIEVLLNTHFKNLGIFHLVVCCSHNDFKLDSYNPFPTMVAGAIITIFKPIAFIWAGLNLIDDMSLMVRLGRLGASVIPFPGKKKDQNSMCGLCDDIVASFMAGQDGIGIVPCNAACLGIPKCIDMCELVQEVSQNSSQFPCVAAGFCDPIDTGYVDSLSMDCSAGAFFSCLPKQYCRRKREKFKFSCELRPGIGRWNGMKHLAGRNAASLVEGLRNQKHCGEEGAGEYCIARPTGIGLVAEMAGHVISFVIAGYKSILAIETPGGNDDRQWLTFWLILCLFLHIERFFARIILSNISFYYELKLIIMIWLVFREGAEKCYRRIRRFFERRGFWIISANAEAEEEISIMIHNGVEVLQKWMERYQEKSKGEITEFAPNKFWQFDKADTLNESSDSCKTLLELSKFILSVDGSKQLEQSRSVSEQARVLLIERAAQVVSFQPRYLRIHLLGCISGAEGELPSMDNNGLADGYVTFHLKSSIDSFDRSKGMSSRIVYRSLSPQWNQEIEIPLKAGNVEKDGFFQSGEIIRSKELEVRVNDADIGLWSIALWVCQSLVLVSFILAVVGYIEGILDNATERQMKIGILVQAILLACYGITYVMAVLRRSDDEVIGVCFVPLGILLDQREHTLLLSLNPESDSEQSNRRSTRNTAGGHGIIRVKLMLSES